MLDQVVIGFLIKIASSFDFFPFPVLFPHPFLLVALNKSLVSESWPPHLFFKNLIFYTVYSEIFEFEDDFHTYKMKAIEGFGIGKNNSKIHKKK